MRLIPAIICFMSLCGVVLAQGTVEAAPAEKVAGGSVFEILKSSDPNARRNACTALGKELRVGAPASRNIERKRRAVTALKKALKDKDSGVRMFAGRSLDLIEKGGAAQALRQVLGNEEDRGVKVEFIRILGKYKTEPNRDVLTSLLTDNDPITRSESVYALGKLGYPESGEKIVGMFADESEGVKVAAAKVAADLELTDAADEVLILLGDPIDEVRLRAARALRTLASVDMIRDIKKYKKKEKNKEVLALLADIIKDLKERGKND